MTVMPTEISTGSKILSIASLGAFATSFASLPFIATTGPVGAVAALELTLGVALAFKAAAKIGDDLS